MIGTIVQLVVVILTQEKPKVPEMTAMCGRFASHVQIIEGSPIDIISDLI